MREALRRLLRVEGSVGRVAYAAAGLIGFAVKFCVDWSIAHAFGRQWRLINYWYMAGAKFAPGEVAVLLLVALPFIWFGVTMTLLRARDAGVPAATIILFFVPVLNLLYFGLLMLLPPTGAARPQAVHVKSESTKIVESAVFAVMISTLIGIVFGGITTWLFKSYGLVLFVGLPFLIGFTAAVLHGYRYPRSGPQVILVALISLLFAGGGFLAFAWEGIICLLMAFPIALGLTLLGALFGYYAQPNRQKAVAACVPIVLPLLALMQPSTPPLIAVETSIDIAASPATVWRNVVAFADIEEEPEWYFKTGIAYPLRARIRGTGVGAVRYCVFTTGAFVEPIEVWDEPRRLSFGVTHTPAPMDELSPYATIRPPHLDGFFVSERGQFLLEPLPHGGTRLTGTTWYRASLYPVAYWRGWSNAIMHRIHLRVLRHIRRLSESSPPQSL